jgi:hypothetical protein
MGGVGLPQATTKRALKWLEKDGWITDPVERWISTPKGARPGFHRDLYGCLDIVAMRPGNLALLGVQSTSFGHRKDRLRKVLDEPRMRTWLMSGCQIWVLGWRPLTHPNHKTPDLRDITLEDFKRS